MGKTLFTQRDGFGNTAEIVACDRHAPEMGPVDDRRLSAAPADDDCRCEFCADEEAW